jgi:hypothetical protein
MFGLTFFGDIVVFIGGVAVGALFKDPVMKWYKGAEAFAQSLKDKADKIKAAL